MASLTVTAGALTSSKSVDNTTFAAMADGFVKATGGPTGGTQQQKLDWCLARLVQDFRDTAKAGKRQQIAEDAAASAGVDNWDLT